MLKSSHWSYLRRCSLVVLVGASVWSTSSSALAEAAAAPAPPPGQKPPCVPAATYTLAYDCELFPLPTLAAPAPAAAPVVAVVAVPVAVVVPAAVAPPVVAPPPEGAPVEPAVEAPAAAVVVPPVPVVPSPPATSSDNDPSHAPAYVAFAVGAGGIAATVVFGILALQAKSTLNGECGTSSSCPATASSTISNLQTDGIIADVGLGVGVAGVALGAILFATEHKSSSSSGSRHVEPWIGFGSAGLKGAF